MGETSQQPYAAFGRTLRSLREQARESLDEVASSVEIQKNQLVRIEKGEIRPSEDILMLLISHFNAAEKEAARLWEQAGYSKDDQLGTDNQPTIVVTTMDNRVVYTDVVHVSANGYGVIVNFMQSGTPGGVPLAVARVGMSREHAKSLLGILGATLAQSEAQQSPKHLPPPSGKA